MTDIFDEFPTRNDVLGVATTVLAERLLRDLNDGYPPERGKFIYKVIGKYGQDKGVHEGLLSAWALLVRKGFLVERFPNPFFVSEDGEREKKRIKAMGLTPPTREVAGRWVVERLLSSGGQGVTSLAHDKEGFTEDWFVIKELRSVADQQARARFETETKALQKLHHPNILRIVQFDEKANPPWFVSEYCAGGGLDKAELSELGIRTRLRLFLEVCSALAAAHKAGITHRDLKPENILIRTSNGPAVLGDFGLCWLADSDDERLTQTHEDIGSSFCRAPELFDGPRDKVAPSADIYCLGKLLYWIVVGKGGRSGRLAREEFEREDKNLVAIFRDARYELINSLLRKMIVDKPTARFRDAGEAHDNCQIALGRFLSGYHPSDRGPSQCRYCGQGAYQRRPGGRGNRTELDILSGWLVYECEVCGHTLLFRKNQSNNAW